VCRSRGVSFGGNLQLTVVLLTGTVDDCKRNTVECMEIGGASGFILAPGCDIPFATPPENLEAVARVVHDPYEHQVALELAKKDVSRQLAFDMSEYGASDRVIVDIITLDSEACAPCQYMVESVKEIAPEFEGLVVWREHKIKYRESIAFMSSLMVHNIPTICIDGQITFVSRIPKRDELIAAIQRRINEKLRTRIETKTNVIQVLGPPTEECLQVRELVRRAILELGANVSYQEVEDPASYQHLAVSETPAVAVVRQKVKSMGKVPSLVAVKEWLKQLEA
jgi:uroporphyrinogen decarboxylase